MGSLLHKKSKVAYKFVDFVETAETNIISGLRYDAMTSGVTHFTQDCNVCSRRIVQSFAPPYTKVNGVDRMMNRILADRARCMITQAGMSKLLRNESIMTAMIIRTGFRCAQLVTTNRLTKFGR